MARSTKKGPYMDSNILKKVQKMDQDGKKQPIKTWSRSCDISPEMVGHTFMVHNGKQFKEVFVSESMVGHKLGEFAPTRRFLGHSKKGFSQKTGLGDA